MNSILPPVKRFYFLDSARGLAAISVTIWHFFTAFIDFRQPGPITTSPLHFFWYGEADVIFFFIHSGFILSYAYTATQDRIKLSSYVRFLIERIFRIYPLFLFILFLSYAFKNSIFPLTNGTHITTHFHSFWTGDYSLPAVLKEAVLVVQIPEESNLRLIPQDWTLTVEIIVGALIPFMALLLKKNKLLYWLAVGCAIKLLHFNTYLFEFAAGVFLFYNWKAISQAWERMAYYQKAITTVTAIVLYSCLFYFCTLFNAERSLFRPGIDRLIVVVGCCLFFCIIICSPFVQKILSHSLFVKIGRVCYSIYLIHMFLLICFADYFMNLLSNWFTASAPTYLAICFVVYILATIFLSFITFSLVEKPFNKMGKRLSKYCEKYISVKPIPRT